MKQKTYVFSCFYLTPPCFPSLVVKLTCSHQIWHPIDMHENKYLTSFFFLSFIRVYIAWECDLTAFSGRVVGAYTHPLTGYWVVYHPSPCIYIYKYTLYTYIYTHTHIHTHTHIYIYIYIYVDIYIYVCAYIYRWCIPHRIYDIIVLYIPCCHTRHARVVTRYVQSSSANVGNFLLYASICVMPSPTLTYVYIYICIHMRIYIYVYTYIYTHTHMYI